MISTDGLPLAYPALRKSSTESTASPRSEIRTGDPFRYATINGLYSAALNSWSLAPISHVRPAFEKCPLGTFALDWLRTPRTSSRPMPYLFSVIGFNSMRTLGSVLPPTITCPTPLTCDSFCAMIVDAASYM